MEEKQFEVSYKDALRLCLKDSRIMSRTQKEFLVAGRGDTVLWGSKWSSVVTLFPLGLWSQCCCICGLHMGWWSVNHWLLSVIRKRAVHTEINYATLIQAFKYTYTHTHVAKTFSVKEDGSLILMFWCKFLTLMRTDTLSIWWTITEGPSVHMNVYVVVRELVGGCYAEFTSQNNFCDCRIEWSGKRQAKSESGPVV